MDREPADAPLWILAGAPGAGKTTLLPYLVRRATGLVVMDMDELLEDGALLGVPVAEPEAAPVWPAYDRMWRRIVDMVRRAGHPVLLLTPVPAPEDLTSDARWTDPAHWALLDCPDAVRLDRLTARNWPQDWIDEAMADASQARALIPVVFDGGEAPSALAERVL
ncbi:AAA family ATPase, partial [Streptosporangium algeriense]